MLKTSEVIELVNPKPISPASLIPMETIIKELAQFSPPFLPLPPRNPGVSPCDYVSCQASYF